MWRTLWASINIFHYKTERKGERKKKRRHYRRRRRRNF
ncbi:hypothetical protein RDI58_011539 [Solanum bulbocastanum]|uniref:Uncharacterized protein n=1 Tax=Solanum bulbocastanum TaxID=147425 RepID=A0AAN8TXI4_SOLBU